MLIKKQTSLRMCNIEFITGADDVIAFNSDDKIYELEERDLLLKELTIRDHYDVVFLTTSQTYNRDFISKFLNRGGVIIDTVEKRLSSDEYHFFMRFLCSVSHSLEIDISLAFLCGFFYCLDLRATRKVHSICIQDRN